ncbi:MAG: hypothetical protein IT204_13425 [Fimbriimonadaceae bacterium]|nr:hypothetical protein [Fimbriimonadaceae bacterium]
MRRWVPVVLLGLVGCGSERSDLLTVAQTQAVESVALLTTYLGSVPASFGKLASLQDQLPSFSFQPFGDCPHISAQREGLGARLTFDYRGSCQVPLAFGEPVSGAVSMAFDLRAFEGEVGFEEFQLGGHRVAGAVALRPVDRRLGRLRVRFANLAVDQIGWLKGEAALALSLDGSLTMQDGELQLRDILDSSYAVKVSGLSFNPWLHGNCVPDGGQVVFVVPLKMVGIDSIEMKVRFLPETPATGKVKVLAGPLGPFDYTLEHVVRKVRRTLDERRK